MVCSVTRRIGDYIQPASSRCVVVAVVVVVFFFFHFFCPLTLNLVPKPDNSLVVSFKTKKGLFLTT